MPPKRERASNEPATTTDVVEGEQPPDDEFWRRVLTGESDNKSLVTWLRRVFGALPAEPRCRMCLAPYRAPFGPVVKALGFGPWAKNPTLCSGCLGLMERHKGGAEVELSIMFADLRGSTGMAARMSASSYSRLLDTYYGIAATAIAESGGIVDKYLGDGVLALFIPAYTGSGHGAAALQAARSILERTVDDEGIPVQERPLPVGVGLHTGTAFVGIVGRSGQPTDFTALGDAVNVAERVSSSAAEGELLVSRATVASLGGPPAGASQRTIELKGVAEPFEAWSIERAARPLPV